MKIGIATFHNEDNFGAVLQAFGLQKALEALGHNALLIDFPSKKEDASLPSSPLMKRILQNQAIRKENFKAFRIANLKTEAISIDKLDSYDIFITGSDQVWNPAITGGKREYLLSFAEDRKRFSYAASFGSSKIGEAYRELFSSEIKKFNRVSVREKSGIELVKELSGREAESHLDPSLLLTRDEYEKVMAPQMESKPYLLLITVQNDIKLLSLAKAEAEKRGLELKTITASFFPQLGFDSWSGVKVEDYLRLIMDAELVLTSSFHGLAFSLIFEKEFMINPLINSLKTRSSRLSELMDALEIGERTLGEPLSPLDWDRIKAKLDKLRGDAYSYLKEITEVSL